MYLSHVCLLSSLLFQNTSKGITVCWDMQMRHNFEKIKFILNIKSIYMYSVCDQVVIVHHTFFLHKFYNYMYCSHFTVYQWESVTCTLNGVTVDSYLNVLVVTSHTQKQTQPSPPVDIRTRDSPRAWGQNCQETTTTKCMHCVRQINYLY